MRGGKSESIEAALAPSKQAHLYANLVTVRRKSLFDQTICNINNNDFVGMSINLN